MINRYEVVGRETISGRKIKCSGLTEKQATDFCAYLSATDGWTFVCQVELPSMLNMSFYLTLICVAAGLVVLFSFLLYGAFR